MSEDAAQGRPVALVLPGVAYTIQGPLLYWPISALVAAGWDVWSINWHDQLDEAARRDSPAFVASQLEEAEEILPARPSAVLAKSFGSYSLPFFLERTVRAVWLTPVLTNDAVSEALRNASESHLAIGGTADSMWLPDRVAGSHARTISVDRADHDLRLSDAPWSDSLALQLPVIGDVIEHLLA